MNNGHDSGSKVGPFYDSVFGIEPIGILKDSISEHKPVIEEIKKHVSWILKIVPNIQKIMKRSA